ncbi:MAG: hypothetical protein O7E52_02830, partial [Candidatus Poribacteria bacterium]|nr:hypothetical protein [Candidatus Poribacteria bacterium]
MRWQAAKLLIDRLQSGDRLSIVDLSGQPVFLSMTELTGDIDQKEEIKRQVEGFYPHSPNFKDIGASLSTGASILLAEPREAAKRAIILLIDSLPDEGGILKENLQPEESLDPIASGRIGHDPRLNRTLSRLAQNSVEVYTAALTYRTDIPLLNAIVTATLSPDQQSTRHEFYTPSSTDLVGIFLQIVNQLQGYSSPTTESMPRLIQAVEEKVSMFFYDPRHREVEIQFTFEKGKDVEITLTEPDGNYIYPYAQEDTYQLYWINKPVLGWWRAAIQNRQGNEIKQTVAVQRDLRSDVIRLVFKPLKTSYALDEKIRLEVEATREISQLSQIDVHAVTPAGTERLRLTRFGDKSVFREKYSPAEFTGEYKFIIAANPQYVADIPLQTVEVVASRKLPFPLFAFFGAVLSGGIVAGALWRRHQMRLRQVALADSSPERSIGRQPVLEIVTAEVPKYVGDGTEDEHIDASLGLSDPEFEVEAAEDGTDADYEASLLRLLDGESVLAENAQSVDQTADNIDHPEGEDPLKDFLDESIEDLPDVEFGTDGDNGIEDMGEEEEGDFPDAEPEIGVLAAEDDLLANVGEEAEDLFDAEPSLLDEGIDAPTEELDDADADVSADTGEEEEDFF